MDHIEQVFQRQQQKAQQLRSRNKTERLLKLRQLKQAILRRQTAIQEACAADFKKPSLEVDVAEIAPVLAEIQHAERHLGRWMRGQSVLPTMLMFGSKTHIRYEPKGVCLIIAPWNYPINLSLMPLVSAIAAGCTVMLKPSELTPHCSQVIRDILEEVFSDDEVAVFEGEAEVAQRLLQLPFGHVFFTGSPAVGKLVMRAAAENLSSVTLELGGKSPTIVDESADIQKAATSIMWGKFGNCGQTCTAPDYLFVHEAIKPAFVRACQERLIQAYSHQPKNSPDYARIVNPRHFQRVKHLITDAVDQGAHVLAGGEFDAGDNYIAPTLLDRVPAQAEILQQEIFGPALPIIGYTDIDSVIGQINQKPKPLALYIYSKNPKLTEHVLQQTSAGGSCVNQCVVQYLHMNAPFGGVNHSGIGNSHGFWGFKAFSHERTVVTNKFSFSHWLAPPYTDFVKRLVAITLASLR